MILLSVDMDVHHQPHLAKGPSSCKSTLVSISYPMKENSSLALCSGSLILSNEYGFMYLLKNKILLFTIRGELRS